MAKSSGSVLLVDDDEVFRDAATKTPENAGFCVAAAPDRREALRVLEGRSRFWIGAAMTWGFFIVVGGLFATWGDTSPLARSGFGPAAHCPNNASALKLAWLGRPASLVCVPTRPNRSADGQDGPGRYVGSAGIAQLLSRPRVSGMPT